MLLKCRGVEVDGEVWPVAVLLLAVREEERLCTTVVKRENRLQEVEDVHLCDLGPQQH